MFCLVTCIFQRYSLNSSHPPNPRLFPQVCSLCLCLYSYPANRITSSCYDPEFARKFPGLPHLYHVPRLFSTDCPLAFLVLFTSWKHFQKPNLQLLSKIQAAISCLRLSFNCLSLGGIIMTPFKKALAERAMKRRRSFSLTEEIEISLIRFSERLDTTVIDAI